jgi:hypothetical protein
MTRRTALTGSILTPSGSQAVQTFTTDVNAIIQTKVKTATETVTSSTTLQDDDHLTQFWLPAGQWYTLEAAFYITQNVGDFKFLFNFTSAPVSSTDFAVWHAVHQDGTTDSQVIQNITGEEVIATMTDANNYGVTYKGGFQANTSSDSSMKLQWAQNTSSGNGTSLIKGSWVKLTKIDIT